MKLKVAVRYEPSTLSGCDKPIIDGRARHPKAGMLHCERLRHCEDDVFAYFEQLKMRSDAMRQLKLSALPSTSTRNRQREDSVITAVGLPATRGHGATRHGGRDASGY